jgi:hypothetical protein
MCFEGSGKEVHTSTQVQPMKCLMNRVALYYFTDCEAGVLKKRLETSSSRSDGRVLWS